jgi:hypothetical protein
MRKIIYFILIIVLVLLIWLIYNSRSDQFELPEKETENLQKEFLKEESLIGKNMEDKKEFFETNGVKHSIPLEEILSGGPGKDGIPSIDNPQFLKVEEIDFLDDDSVGLGIILGESIKFYPYQILVWHEIVNDKTGDKPLLVTYCPLCATGIVFDPIVNGRVLEFGVSGKLWKSNLLMYDRRNKEEDESLWSQVLGEAVVGNLTGKKLNIISSGTFKYGDWKKKYPQTLVLSKKTGSLRSYGVDPYGNYYSSRSVSFGVSFNDERTHPKSLVLGIEIEGQFKAYIKDILKKGETTDNFNGKEIKIKVDDIGKVEIFADNQPLPYIEGFWFSWLAVHPLSELFIDEKGK